MEGGIQTLLERAWGGRVTRVSAEGGGEPLDGPVTGALDGARGHQLVHEDRRHNWEEGGGCECSRIDGLSTSTTPEKRATAHDAVRRGQRKAGDHRGRDPNSSCSPIENGRAEGGKSVSSEHQKGARVTCCLVS
ncbi:hypothetical protein BD311DRAFT_762534 [Dichomitus squalens]|uniref:Uncharacterized protein n=1 Tax=Dichomitus squalens TaxID=114155 RepID=A0A4Q9MGE4_9APHY|nr:hypothetical protein BD311DRAFT_762534 [Dichomitus squalens]